MNTKNVCNHDSGEDRLLVGSEKGNQPVPSVSDDTKGSSAGYSAAGKANSNRFMYLFVGFSALINVTLFLMVMLCYADQSIAADAANVVMLEQMLEQSYSKTVRLWAQYYSDYMQLSYPNSPRSDFEADRLAECILDGVRPEVAGNALSRFRAQIGHGRREDILPDDFDDHYDEIMDCFRDAAASGELLEERLKGLGSAKELSAVRRLLKNGAVKDAVSLAAPELALHIGGRLPGILQDFHREHTGGELLSGMLNDALETVGRQIMPFDQGGALLGRENDCLVEPPSEGEEDIPALKLLEKVFNSGRKVLKGPVAMGAILYSEELRLAGKKNYGDITGHTKYAAFERTAFAEEFYDEVLVGRNLTGRQLVEYIDRRLAVQFQIRFPASEYNRLCDALDKEEMLDTPVVESMYPIRKQGDYRRRMIGYISDAVRRNRKAIQDYMDGVGKDERH